MTLVRVVVARSTRNAVYDKGISYNLSPNAEILKISKRSSDTKKFAYSAPPLGGAALTILMPGVGYFYILTLRMVAF